MLSIASAVPALRAAGLVGVWNTNVAAGRSILDEGAAALLAGNASLAGQPIPMEVALSRTHPDDRPWVFERIRRVRQTGGPFSAEFRVLTEGGQVRWVLNRGLLKADGHGAMHGLGAYIDTTDSHGHPFLTAPSPDQDADDRLALAADRCIEAHAVLKSGGHTDLRLRAESLLIGIGRALARRRD
ncbi:hypothetical protein CFIICLFH_4966 [Methylobacterium goesingense]|nr:hypothetical protein CFIICLFH_4966 [Methylobacterium goesingense]